MYPFGCEGKAANPATNNPAVCEGFKMNFTTTVEGNQIVIRATIQAPTPSATGKTLVVASSRGNKETTALVNGQPVYIGFNAYIYPPRK